MSTPAPPKLTERPNWLLFGGLLGLSASAVLQLTGMEADKRTDFSRIAVYCFAVAVPLIGSNLIAEITRPLRLGQRSNRLRTLFGWTGILAAIGGAACCFFHLDLIAGGVFVATGVVSLFAIRRL